MRLRDGRSARTPDLFFIAREHLVRLDEQRLNGPADLVVEVVSAESATRDRVEKFAEYEAAGVREYWLVDTRPGNEGTEFFRLAATGTYEPVTPDADGRLHSTALPGFWLKPEWLWQEPRPNPLTLLAEIAPHAVRDALDPGERDV